MIHYDVITLILKITAVRGWLLKDKNLCTVPYVLWANAPCELAIKHSLGLQTEISVPGYKIIDDCFQQSSQANALQWSQTNVASNRKGNFCKWQRGMCDIREPLMSAPRESASRMWNSLLPVTGLHQCREQSTEQLKRTGSSSTLQRKNRTGRLFPECLVAH